MNRTALCTASLLLPLLSTACVSKMTRETSLWNRTSLLHIAPGTKLGGCVLADFDPTKPGDELVVTASDGAIYYLSQMKLDCPVNGEWATEKVFEAPGEMIQCAAGDLDPSSPGDELVVVGALSGGEDDGGPGAVWLGRLTGGTWAFEKLLDDEALVHAVSIGELDSAHEGLELLVAGFTNEVHLLSLSGGHWDHQVVGTLNAPAKGAAIAAGKAFIACNDGALVQLEKGAQGWSMTTLEQHPKALARITANEDSVLYSSNDGKLRLRRDGKSTVVYSSDDRLRGAVLYELDAEGEGLEFATAGYDGIVAVISTTSEGERKTSRIGGDGDRLHHLAVGEVLDLGTVLVACGYSGTVIIFQR